MSEAGSQVNVTVPKGTVDEKVLMMKFREMDLKEQGGHDTTSLSLDDIARQMSETKRLHREQKEAARPKRYIPPGGWGKMDPEMLASRPRGKPDPVEKAKKSVYISKFKELAKPKIWDGSLVPGQELVKVLWRSTIADGSGHRIFNLSREAYPKDIPATWKPGSFDKDLPVPGLDPFAHHPHRQTLVKIVSDQTVRVEKELKSLPQRTTAERNYKATMTADLNKLQACKKQVLEGFAEIDKREKDTEEALKTRREELRASGKLPRRTMKGTSKGGTSKGLSGKIGDQSRLEEGNVKEEKDAGEAKAQGEQEKRPEQEEGKEQDSAGPGEEKKD